MLTKKLMTVANPPTMARLIGITPQAVYLWLDLSSEPPKNINISLIQNASSKYGVSIDEFWENLQSWILEQRERRKLQQELNTYLDSFEQHKNQAA
ncbi:MAG: hypothetical protein QNJ55_31520 [Xenococcus sp. MO_188.B8]|nr:hypothetical protein [Xenococcus sp. MO_188.B8]